jgi:hypothetical protein
LANHLALASHFAFIVDTWHGIIGKIDSFAKVNLFGAVSPGVIEQETWQANLPQK